MTHCITINMDCSWEVKVHGLSINTTHCPTLSHLPPVIDCTTINLLLDVVNNSHICTGNPDDKFVEMVAARKGKTIKSSDGSVAAYIDQGEAVSTIRSSKCEVLMRDGRKCDKCVSYRDNLRMIHHRTQGKSKLSPTCTSSHTNFRYLDSPQKLARYKKLKERCDRAEKEIKRLKENIAKLMDEKSVAVDEPLHQDLTQIMEDHTHEVVAQFPEDSFQRLFWNQQLQSVRVKDSRQIRWHPMIIKWCLHLKMISSAAYHAMRSSGFIKLPSERTLRDYTHVVRGATGIQPEVSAQLIKESKVLTLQDWQKYAVVVFDEVKIKEDLVYNKHTCEIVGFVDLGSVNNKLSSLAELASLDDFDPESVATHMLVFMFRGLFIRLEFPYAQYATKTAIASEICLMAWEVVRNLECCGFKVIALSCDGASTNRRFFRMHGTSSSNPLYKTTNPYSPEKRNLYFISDVPHLMKTVRNCWSHSFAHGGHRPLWVNICNHLLLKNIPSLYVRRSKGSTSVGSIFTSSTQRPTQLLG